MKRPCFATLAAVGVLAFFIPVASMAQEDRAAADFYRGKTVRLLVGFGIGGGTDTMARQIARHMGKHIPGNPTVIVENKPGAGGILAGNLISESESKDGTVIGVLHENVVIGQAIGRDGIKFDVRRLQWIGSPQRSPGTACVVSTASGVKNINELLAGKQVIMGALQPGSGTYDTPVMLNATIGTTFKLVPGYTSGSALLLAMQQKETDGWCVNFDSMLLTARELLEGSNPALRVVVMVADKVPDHPLLKGVPTAESLAKTAEAKQMLQVLQGPTQSLAFPFVVAPEVRKDRVAVLRAAFAATLADQEFRSEASKAKMEVDLVTGEEIERVVQKVMATPAPVLAKIKLILK